MNVKKPITRAIVLGGGGVAGIAWELGVLNGLFECGLDVRRSNLVIGTSAGSAVGAQITSGATFASLFAAQQTPVAQSKERLVPFDAPQLMEQMQRALAGANGDLQLLRARIGAYALAAQTISEADRLEIIAARLPKPTWPQQRLVIVAVDTANGDDFIITRDSGVSLLDAVAASCAVPGIWPPVTIAGHRYMDGGMRSITNADLASGYDRILILNPAGDSMNFFGGTNTADEVAALERAGSQVFVISPEAAAIAAIGLNPLDPATRAPASQAGRSQGHDLGEQVAAFWSPS